MKPTFRTSALAVAATLVVAACGTNNPMQRDSAGGTAAPGIGSTTTAGGTSGKPDQQMQQVLNELQALGAKPLHTLTVEEARKGPTPADAVRQVLQKQGKSTEPTPVAHVADGAIPGPAGPIPRAHLLARRHDAGQPADAGGAVHPRRRLGHRRPRHLRLIAARARQCGEGDRRLDALPPGAGAQVPGRA